MKYETILFDVDGTLLDFRKDQDVAFEKALASIGVSCTKGIYDMYQTINHKLWRQMEQGKISRQEVVWNRFRNLFDVLKIKQDEKEFQEIFSSELEKTGTLLPNAKKVIQTLSETHQLVVVTNSTPKEQYGRLTNTGIISCFKKLYISQEIGYNKPDERFFKIVLEEIATKDLTKILMVGDSLTADIAGAKNMGITTCWYHKEGLVSSGIKPDYEITDLIQLLQMV